MEIWFHFLYFSLPSWAEKVLETSNDVLEYFAAIYIESLTHTIESQKARAGFLIKEIFDRFKNKTMGLLHPDRSLWLYSAHDTTIVGVLNSLKVFKVFILSVICFLFIVQTLMIFQICSMIDHPLDRVFILNCTSVDWITMYSYFTEKTIPNTSHR